MRSVHINQGSPRHLRRGRVAGLVLAFVASSLALVSSPASAHGGSHQVAVGDGESIQAAIDAAAPGTTITVRGDHVENLWIQTDGIKLVGKNASLTMTDEPTLTPCSFFGAPPTLICVHPAGDPENPEPPSLGEYIDGVSISGFTLTNPAFDAIGVLFSNDVSITRNTIVAPGCDGVFAIFTTDVEMSRNTVTDAGCSGLHAQASSNVNISRNAVSDSENNGIDVADASNVVIERNRVSGNCFGIVASDGADGGYGIRAEEFPGTDVKITRNTANENNRVCQFGPFSIGAAGIVSAGTSDVTISRNTASNNVTADESLTAAGIWVGDFPNEFGPPTQSSGVTVSRNIAFGNSSAAGPRDLSILALDVPTVSRNRCGVSDPDASWCS